MAGPCVCWVVAIVFVVGTLRVGLFAQNPVSPAFEVASVKPNRSGSTEKGFRMPPGRFTATNVTLGDMIRFAYGTPPPLPSNQLSGGEKWIRSDPFDLNAKAEGNPSQVQFSLMLRTLLADRFRLSVHIENKELPVYALMMGKSDVSVGSQLRRSEVDCSAVAPPSELLLGANQPAPLCQIMLAPGTRTGRAVTMAELARSLDSAVGRPVRDHTNLAGRFDFELTWTPDRPPQSTPETRLPPIDPDRPSIYTAIKEQLGLRLESDREPLDVIVIDHAEKPTED